MIMGHAESASPERPRRRLKRRHAKRPEFEAIREFQLAGGLAGRILHPLDGKMARKVRPGWQTRATGTFDSRKSNSPLAFESSLERDALLICEYDDEIVELRTQPYEVEIDTQPRKSRSYPDFEVVLRGGARKIIQVKSRFDLEKPVVTARLLRDQAIFEGLGWEYEVWPQSFIRTHPLLENARCLHHYRRHQATPEMLAALREAFRERPEISAHALCAEGMLRMTDVHMLLGIRLLQTDLRQPLGPPSILSLRA